MLHSGQGEQTPMTCRPCSDRKYGMDPESLEDCNALCPAPVPSVMSWCELAFYVSGWSVQAPTTLELLTTLQP